MFFFDFGRIYGWAITSPRVKRRTILRDDPVRPRNGYLSLFESNFGHQKGAGKTIFHPSYPARRPGARAARPLFFGVEFSIFPPPFLDPLFATARVGLRYIFLIPH